MNEETKTASLRQGIRAGSRWPFTNPASFLPDQFRFGGYIPYPMFMNHAAGYTKGLFPTWDISVRDSIARGESYDTYFKGIKYENPDYLVIETATSSLEHDLRIVAKLGEVIPSCKIILAGMLNQTDAKPILDSYSNVHAICEGEYDKQIGKALMPMRMGFIPFDKLSESEMNAAPFPIHDEQALMNYFDACPEGTKAPQLQLWSSRGCTFRCCFCSWPAVMTNQDSDGTGLRSFRRYTPEYIAAYLDKMLERYAFKTVYFDDDTFNSGDKHVLGICEVMKKRNLHWSAMCRADMIKRETWQAMKDSGCFGVKIGFETGSQRVIDEIVGKKLNLEKARDTAIWLRSIGIAVHGTFTKGLPGETPEESLMTDAFIEKLYQDGGLDTHQLSGTAVIHGTPMERIAKGEHLARYNGAKVDENFVEAKDGVKKAEDMRN